MAGQKERDKQRERMKDNEREIKWYSEGGREWARRIREQNQDYVTMRQIDVLPTAVYDGLLWALKNRNKSYRIRIRVCIERLYLLIYSFGSCRIFIVSVYWASHVTDHAKINSATEKVRNAQSQTDKDSLSHTRT